MLGRTAEKIATTFRCAGVLVEWRGGPRDGGGKRQEKDVAFTCFFMYLPAVMSATRSPLAVGEGGAGGCIDTEEERGLLHFSIP